MPRVSVVMPVYNGERFLAQAIESILAQTYTDFEFIIVCEYETNQASINILKHYALNDSRIVVLHNNVKRGLPITLNIGLRAAIGDYIVRMDGDDIALPTRLEKQTDFMDANPDIVIAGCKVKYIDENGNDLNQKDNLSDNDEQIKSDFLFFCLIHHPAVIMRVKAVTEHNLYYDESFMAAEDYELWCRAVHAVKFAKVPEPLLKYRWHFKSASHTNNNLSNEMCLKIMRVNFERLGISPQDTDLKCLCRTTCFETFSTAVKIERLLNSYYDIIIKKNREQNLYNEQCLVNTLNRRMYWKRYKLRYLAVVILKSVSKLTSNGRLFYLAIYLELNGFSAVFRRLMS